MKHIKTLVVRLDGKVYHSNSAPEPIEDMDGHCPACGSDAYVEIITLVQHGFAVDDCLTVLSCGDCYESFHYQYTVDSPMPLTPWPMAFH